MPNPLDPLGIWKDAQRRAREAMGAMQPMVVRGREWPMRAPAVIGPRERRQAPKELEFFADSREQLLASTHPYRAQMDAAFREAIERVRG